MAGVPRGVMWPAKVVSDEEQKLLVYIKSDNLELTVKKENVFPCTTEQDDIINCKHKFQSILERKRKKSTAYQLEKDIDWVLEEILSADSDQEMNDVDSDQKVNDVDSNQEVYDVDGDQEVNDVDSDQEMNDVDSDQEVNDVDSDQEVNDVDSDQEMNDVDSDQEVNDVDSDQEVNDVDSDQEMNDVDIDQEVNDVDSNQKVNDVDSDQKVNDVDSDQEVNDVDSDQEVNDVDSDQEVNDDDSDQEVNDVDSNQKVNDVDSDQEVNDVDSDQEVNDDDSDQEVNDVDSNQKVNDVDRDQEVNDVDSDQEVNDVDSNQKVNDVDSDQEVNDVDSDQEVNDVDSNQKVNDVDRDQEVNDVDSNQEVNDVDGDQEVYDVDSDQEVNDVDSDQEVNDVDSDQEVNDVDSDQEVNDVDSDQEVNDVDSDQEVYDVDGDQEVNDVDGDQEVNDVDSDHSENVNCDQVIEDDDMDKDYIPESDADSDFSEENTNAELGKSYLPNFLKFIDKKMKSIHEKEQEQTQEVIFEQETINFRNVMNNKKPVQRKVKENEIVRDVQYRNIYIKKYVKSQEGKSGLKKDDRPYDTVHACKFCQNVYTHIQDHIEKKHKDQEEVQEIFKIREQIQTADDISKITLKKKVKQLQGCIRFSGDHIHNALVKDCKEGELLIQRKSCAKDEFRFEDYGPCPNCLQWIKLESSANSHQKNCPQSVDVIASKKKRHIIYQAKQLLGDVEAFGSGMLKKEVFLIMRSDDVSQCAQADPLIANLGDVWLSKSIGHKLRRGRDSSFHMRLAAKLLLACRKCLKEPSLDMFGLLTMKNFDSIVDVTLNLCGTNEHEELAHPSTANKVGFDLGRLVSLKYGLCLRNNDNNGKEEADGFLKLMKIEWSTKVTKRVAELLKNRHFENRRQLPHPRDIETVANTLTLTLKKFNYSDKNLYTKVAKTALVRLMLYNRRRSGEIEELLIETYLRRKRDMDDLEVSLLGELSTTEQYLIKSQELMWIRGKRGKRVPVLIPPDTNKALEYVVDPEVRTLARLKPTNKYMFATRGDGIISASECVTDLGNVHQLELIHPERLTSTGYRAYMATMAQCLGLKDHQIKWLCSHLGHTEDVHMTHYRFALDGIERMQLGKLLLIQDRNLLSKYRDTRLEDVQFEDILSAENDSTNSEPTKQMDTEMDDLGLDNYDVTDVTSNDVTSNEVVKKKVKPAAPRLRWTEKEIAELKKYAVKYLKEKKTPSRKVCEKFIEESRKVNGLLQRRTSDLIVKKISALNVKARKDSGQ